MNINKSEWKSFKISEVFRIKRGKRLVRLNQIDGDIPYISSTKKNNGIDNYINPPDYMIIYENTLTLNNSGSVGHCFYHPYKFVCSDHCTTITIKNDYVMLNPYIALFLKPIIESLKYKYNFGREMSDKRLKRENIILPTDKNRNPDWDFMEKYIKELSRKIEFKDRTKKTEKNRANKINTSKWKWFGYDDLFDITGSKTTPLLELEKCGKGQYPYVTTQATNNGVAGLYNFKTDDGNILTVDSAVLGYCSYQELDFSASDHVEKLIPKFKLNKYIAMFLVTMINLEQYRYGYGRKSSQKRMKKAQLKLPTKPDGRPDFDFMENYIKSLPYSSNLKES